MTVTNHTNIAGGAPANAATFNAPLEQLDAAIGTLPAEIVTARGGYGSLNARLASLASAGGNISTLTNGAAGAGQKEAVVDSSTGFIAGAHVIYALVGGVLEYNLIADIHSPTQLTLTANIGTGGIADNAIVAMISASEYAAATVIPHGGTYSPTLPATMGIVSQGIYNVKAYGASGNGATDDTAAIQLAIDAADAGGGIVLLPPGRYLVSGTLTIATVLPLLVLGYGAKLELSAGVIGFQVHQAISGLMGAVIEGLEIDGNSAAGTIGVQFYNTTRAKVANCHIHHCATGVEFKAVTADASLGSGLQDVWIESCQLINVLIRYCTIGVDFAPAVWNNGMNTSFGQTRLDSVDIGACDTGIYVRQDASVYRSTFTNVTCWFGTDNCIGLRVSGSMEHDTIDFSCEKSGTPTPTGTIGIQIDSTALLLHRSILRYASYAVDTAIVNSSSWTAFATDKQPVVIPLIRSAVPATAASTSPTYAPLIPYQNCIGLFPIDNYRAAGGTVRVTAVVQGNQAGSKTMRVRDVTNAVTLCFVTWTGNAVERESSDWKTMPEWASTEAVLELQFTTETAGETVLVHDAWLQFK